MNIKIKQEMRETKNKILKKNEQKREIMKTKTTNGTNKSLFDCCFGVHIRYSNRCSCVFYTIQILTVHLVQNQMKFIVSRMHRYRDFLDHTNLSVERICVFM